MSIRILPEDLVNQIAAGEVVERPASVVKELIENALDAGADQIVIDVVDGGRTLISVIDNGSGMSRDDLGKCIMRHATSKLSGDNLQNINFMGFRGEALPSIASVSDMAIDTCQGRGQGFNLDCTTGKIRPSAWESGTRIRVSNLFAKTPARLKFLRSDRAEMLSVVETVKRLACSRAGAGFILNNRWRFPKGQPLIERIEAVMGEEVRGRMIEINNAGADGCYQPGQTHVQAHMAQDIMPLRLRGFISEPTLRRASGIDQYLFVNGRPVKDKVLIGALRAAYLDVMGPREFPLCALYLDISPSDVDVNVSPAKTEVHFLEPSRIRSFIIKTIREALAAPMANTRNIERFIYPRTNKAADKFCAPERAKFSGMTHCVREQPRDWDNRDISNGFKDGHAAFAAALTSAPTVEADHRFPATNHLPLGRVIGQIGNKYVVAENVTGLVIVDQHAAHERIVYERLRKREIQRQVLLVPLVIKLKPEEVSAVSEAAAELSALGLVAEEFGDDSIVIRERPADWDMDWTAVLRDLSQEIMEHGQSSKLAEKLHLRMASHACHHSVRAGQKLDYAQMDALLRDVENTERAGQCNHGRPVYRLIPFAELDGWFERT